MMAVVRVLLAVLLILACAGCAERPVIGIELGSQKIQDCMRGSVTQPCN